ncbi:hypothetical protein As57867_006353, partial [Aphanomyces stellatus]
MGRRDLTNEEREAIIREVLLKSNGSYMTRLPKGFGQSLADKYLCGVSTVRKVIALARHSFDAGDMTVCIGNKKKGKVGRKMSYTKEQIKNKLLEVPLSERTTLRSISEKTGIPLGSLHRYLKQGLFRAHSSSIRPLLTDANKYARLKYAAALVGPTMQFNDMLDVVHLDEKWFYLTTERRRFYLVPGEKEPERKCKSK